SPKDGLLAFGGDAVDLVVRADSRQVSLVELDDKRDVFQGNPVVPEAGSQIRETLVVLAGLLNAAIGHGCYAIGTLEDDPTRSCVNHLSGDREELELDAQATTHLEPQRP